jgi:HlyD family secretion protein
MTRKTVMLVVLVLTASITVGAFYSHHTTAISAPFSERATRGDIVSAVAATGTLSAVTTVEVGTEVSGIIEFLGADFNQIVQKGQILARLDPSIYQTTLEQAKAALASAQADAERYRVTQAAADTTLTRARQLHAEQLMTDEDFQAAETDSRSAAAQVASGDAVIRQARSAVETAQVNLSKTIIESPIAGVVISRSVDVGQTVSASVSAPTLFVIAADLSKMQVDASIDEADVGRVKQGQPVSFQVDAFPDETFTGKVLQVRLNPTVDSNVVTYTTIVDAPNAGLKLKPGMTATLSIVVTRHHDVLRVPAAALKFKPGTDVLARYGARGTTLPAGKANTVWISNGTTIAPVPVTIGISDGVQTEIVSAPFGDGTAVVTRMTTTS